MMLTSCSVVNSKNLQPKIVIIRRRPNQGFGFTLRHFIAYPPDENSSWSMVTSKNDGCIPAAKAMETIFIKEVHPNGPACHANLQTGDRVLMVNNIPIAGIAYGTIVSMIKQTKTVLTLHVVPKECDVLQMHYTSIAHTPETNRGLSAIPLPLVKMQMSYSSDVGSSSTFNQQNMSAQGFSVNGTPERRIDNICHSPQNLIKNNETWSPKVNLPTVSESVADFSTENTLLAKDDFGYVSSQPSHLADLHKKQTLSSNCSSSSTTGNNDLMLRLRESIKQKEEFLKSPLLNVNQHQQQQKQQTFFPNTSPSESRNVSVTSVYLPSSRIQTDEQLKISLSDSNTNTSSQLKNFKDLSTISCDMSNLYSSNQNDNINWRDGRNDNAIQHQSNLPYSGRGCFKNYSSELEYVETLQDTGVTNKVFERKLVSHLSRGFDPFKPLSINTSSNEPNTLSNNVVAKKVVYDSLEHHPLHHNQFNQFCFPQEQNVMQKSNGIVKDVRQQCHLTDLQKSFSGYSSSISSSAVKTSSTGNADVRNLISSNVMRRYKASSAFEDTKPMRRISYLRATNNEIDYFQSESPTVATLMTQTVCSEPQREDVLKNNTFTEPIYDVVACGHEFVETAAGIEEVQLSKENDSVPIKDERFKSFNTNLKIMPLKPLESNAKLDPKDTETDNGNEILETEIEMKAFVLNGKRISEFRSWRQVKISIKGDILKIYPIRGSKMENAITELNIRNFKITDESADKKKYIFRMESKAIHIARLESELNIHDKTEKMASSTNAEDAIDVYTPTDVMFKIKSAADMKRIFGFLQWKMSLFYNDVGESGKQLAEPQKTPATSSVSTVVYCDDNLLHVQKDHVLSHEDVSLSRGELDNCDSISPVMKTRKSNSQKNIPDKDLGSPKSKNWKDLLFRRGGSTSNSADVSPLNLATVSKTIGSIGFPLKSCPMSKTNEYLPRIVDVCTNIVETKGLGIVGIYRIPGNKAAISDLSEQVNKHDFSWDRCNTDVRWEDVNVVSSLLKLFIRSLPDALLPSSFYNHFIEADKKTGLERLKELKELLESLPRHSYETMKHLIRHLNRVSKNCKVNLMEPKNLAIIFGPSIVRTPNDTLEIAVKDMKHQCRIVELLVTQYEYFFENGEIPDLRSICGNNITPVPGSTITDTSCHEDQTKMLLHNVSKIERFTEREASRTSRFIPQLRRRTQSKRGTGSSDTYSGESVLSLDSMKSPTMHINNRCPNTQTIGSSSSSSSTAHFIKACTPKKKDRISFLGARTHLRKTSLDEKDSGSGSGTSSFSKEREQRSSVDISTFLTDDESNNSRLSDTGSMSLTTITDTLDTKLRNLRSGSESNDENDSPDFFKNRRHTVGEPLHLHSENIPYADESPERYFQNCNILDDERTSGLNRSCTISNTKFRESIEKDAKDMSISTLNSNTYRNSTFQQASIVPVICSNNVKTTASLPVTTMSTTSIDLKSQTYMSRNLRFSTTANKQCCSEDDSEGSTTSNPKESLITTSISLMHERYTKKKRDHKLFRSASFNCRNYSSRYNGSTNNSNISPATISSLTKDEKTDMNLTKKRQIQNKQNRSIKRRHTVGGPHDYSSGNTVNGCNFCNNKNSATTNILKRISIPNTRNSVFYINNNPTLSDINTGNESEHVLEVGIRIKNINRNRYSNI